MAPHRSWWHSGGITYNLQRHFPFRYFTLSLTIILVILFALSTVYNIAINGFDLQPVYATNPNATQSLRPWFLNSFFTLGDDKLHPKCPPREIEVGSYFTTTNLGYSYVLNSVSRQTNGSARRTTYPSVAYLNNSLQNCRVTHVDLFLVQKTAVADNSWFDWTGSYASASARCEIENGEGLLSLDFTTTYGPSDAPYTYITNDDPETHASIWWGMQLLRCYWIGTTTLMGMDKVARSGGAAPYINAVIHFYPNQSHVGPPDSLDLFDIKYSFIDSNGGILHQGIDGIKPPTARYNNPNFRISQPLTESLSFARLYYSLIQLDLGQTNQSYLLATDESLKSTLLSPNNFNRQPGGSLTNSSAFDFYLYAEMNSPIGDKNNQNIPLNQTYDRLRDQTGDLGTEKAYISQQYTCSVPTRKSTGTIVWSTLVANFVLIALARTFCLYIAELILTNRDPTAMYCEGCAARLEQRHEDSELVPIRRTAGNFATDDDDIAIHKRSIIKKTLGFSRPSGHTPPSFDSGNGSYSLIRDQTTTTPPPPPPTDPDPPLLPPTPAENNRFL